jgi:hypothetical protein
MAQNLGFTMFVEIPSTGGGYFRLVRGNRHVSADGKVWQAAGMEISIPEESAEGSLGELSLGVSNVSRVPLAMVETGDILGQTFTLWLQHQSNFAAFVPGLSWTHVAVRAVASDKALVVTCGHPAGLLKVPFPVFDRTRFRQLLPQGGR